MAILKFYQNVPVALTLTRAVSTPAPSQYGRTEFKWSAKGNDGKPTTFYAPEDLDRLLTRGLKEDHIAVGEVIQITRIQNGAGTAWDVRNHAEPNFYAEHHAAPPAKAPAPTKPAPNEKAPTPEESLLDASMKSPITVKQIAALYTQAYLEVRNAMHALNGAGLSDEFLRQAAASVFIESARRQLRPDGSRLKELIQKAA